MYVISIACLDKKLFVFEDWPFSLFLHSLVRFLRKFYTEFQEENMVKSKSKINLQKIFSQVIYSKSGQ